MMDFASVLELISTVLGLIQGVLVALNKRINWIFYIAQMFSLIVFSWLNHLYGDVANNAVYFCVGIIGFIWWGRDKGKNVGICSWAERFICCIIIAAGSIILFYVLRGTTDPLPLLDSFTTISSFAATYYMVRKKIETWVIWFINDIAYVVEYFLLPRQAVMLGVLNIIWTGLAVFSFWKWLKIYRVEQHPQDNSNV